MTGSQQEMLPTHVEGLELQAAGSWFRTSHLTTRLPMPLLCGKAPQFRLVEVPENEMIALAAHCLHRALI